MTDEAQIDLLFCVLAVYRIKYGLGFSGPWYQSYSTGKAPLLFEVLKRRGGFSWNRENFQILVCFYCWKRSEMLRKRVFSIEKLQFWELFLKKIAPAARSFRIPTTSNNPRRSENGTVQISSSVLLYRCFQRFLHLERAVKAPQGRKFWRKSSNNNDFR